MNLCLAYSASRLPRIRAKKAQRFAYFAFGGLLILTPLFLAPINYVTMGDLWADVPGIRWMLAGLSASLVDIAIALVAFADGSLLPKEQDLVSATAEKLPKKRKQPEPELLQPEETPEPALPQPTETTRRRQATDEEWLRYLAENPGATQQQVADHFGVTRQAAGKRIKKVYTVAKER